MGAPEPWPRQGGQICGGAAQPPPPWPPFLPPAPQYSPSPSAAAVSQFFSASCVPVNNPKSYPASLCALCVGDERGRNKCVGNSQERYYGYSGAFRYPGGPGGWARRVGLGPAQRQGPSCPHSPWPLCGRCLVEDAGDVAFVKHTTIFDNTNGTLWGAGARAGPDSGGAVPHLRHDPGTGRCWHPGSTGSGERLSLEGAAPWGPWGPHGPHAKNRLQATCPGCRTRGSLHWPGI